jgi:stage V sporulation protein G
VQLTEIRINLCPGPHGAGRGPRGNGGTHHGSGGGSRLRAFCSLTFDDTFVVRDVKLIEGDEGLFLAMPSRKLADHCPTCGDKNHLRARYCNQCGGRLDEQRHLRYRNGNFGPGGAGGAARGPAGPSRLKLHADIAHPINASCRQKIEQDVFRAYWGEVERSKQPGYVPPSLDGEDFDFYDAHPARPAGAEGRAPGAMPGRGGFEGRNVRSETRTFRPAGTAAAP